MKKLAALAIFIIFSNVSYAKDDDTPSSTLSSGDVIDFIDNERDFLHGNNKVDLIEQFASEAPLQTVRYGNIKTVLNLKGLSFSGEDLSGVILTMANMANTGLGRTNLTNSDLVHVDFTGADLKYTDFSRADLSNARFENNNLEGTKFDGANLFGANFDKISGISKEQLAELKKRTKSYVNLERRTLKGVYD